MDRENEVAGLLVSNYGVPIKYFQLAIEWQRERGGSLIDILLEMRATTPEDVQRAAEEIGDALYRQGRRTRLASGTQELKTPAIASEIARRGRSPDGFVVTVAELDGDIEICHMDLGSMEITTADDATIGARVKIGLQSPRGNELTLDARVRSCLPVGSHYAIDLEFEELGPVSLLVLDSIVKELKSARTA